MKDRKIDIPLTIDQEQHPLLCQIASGARWLGQGVFPSWSFFSDEVEKWLEVALLHGEWPHYLPRLRQVDARHRDETLSELAAAFFLERIAYCPIVSWEPVGRDDTPGEYLCEISGIQTFCEVKSPGWEAAYVREQGKGTKRLRQPKYLGSEARGIDNSPDLWHSIEKAYSSMPEDRPTLLIVADDLWFPLYNDDIAIHRVLHYKRLPHPYIDSRQEGCFTSPAYERLGGVGFLAVVGLPSGRIEYRFRVFQNGYALPAVRIPGAFISQWQRRCMFCEHAQIV